MYATCHTETCSNAEHPIPVREDVHQVACGACGQPVTDLGVTPPELPQEVPAWLE